jgi:hypothetical protein
VMKEMNSDTHSCTHSLASLAILALSGKDFFMMRATLYKIIIIKIKKHVSNLLNTFILLWFTWQSEENDLVLSNQNQLHRQSCLTL